MWSSGTSSNLAERTNCYAGFGYDKNNNLFFNIYDNDDAVVKELLNQEFKEKNSYLCGQKSDSVNCIMIDKNGKLHIEGRSSF